MMRVIVTGTGGQLGRAVKKVLKARGFTILEIPDRREDPDFDVGNHAIVARISEMYPELVIHCAAMTNVDGCAKDPDAAFQINAFGAQNIAHACLRCNTEMVYISTNEVFSGRASQPYTEDDKPQPVNPYGSSKRAGEQMAAHYLKDKLYIVRVAWLYSPNSYMFPAKIINAADKNGHLRVVSDEISNPTYAPDVAEALAQLVQTRAYGIYHLVNSGHCSRYEFAQEILRLSGRTDIPIEPITLADYPRPSIVPPFTALANTRGAALDITLRPWQAALADYFAVSPDLIAAQSHNEP